jgi:hypothetical protein
MSSLVAELALCLVLARVAVYSTCLVADSRVVFNEIHYHPAETLDRHEFIEFYNAGDSVSDVSDWRIQGGVSFQFPDGSQIEAGGYLVVASDPEVMWQDFDVAAAGPFDGRLSNGGETVRLVDRDGLIVDTVSYRPGFPWPTAAAGGDSSMELTHPDLDNALGSSWRSSGFGGNLSLIQSMQRLEEGIEEEWRPTPGKQNSSFQEILSPSVLGVSHSPLSPTSKDRPLVEVSIPGGHSVRTVSLLVQSVTPGAYVPGYYPLQINVLRSEPSTPRQINLDFAAPSVWSRITMKDDGVFPDRTSGDGVFTVELKEAAHRTLVRYRVELRDGDFLEKATVVPFADDPSLNFSYFVYDGIPEYKTTSRSILAGGAGSVHSQETMRSVQTYHLLAREPDLMISHGYNHQFRLKTGLIESRKTFNWEGALVYDGRVYDHVRYRLRQNNDRYTHGFGGKRALRFRFNRTHRFQAHDDEGRRYELPWRSLNLSKLIDGKQNQTFGLPEAMNSWLWNLVDIPAPRTHYVQLRVVDRTDEAPTESEGQFHGDFWGLFLAFEDYDARFIQSHDMPDGNLYLLKSNIFDGNQLKRHQGSLSVPGDDDFQNIRQNLRPEREGKWLRQHVDFPRWYRYHTVNEAVRHFDYLPLDRFSKNRAWFFDSSGESGLGRLWVLPWDSDTSWGPNWGVGLDYPKSAIVDGWGKSEFKTEYRNFIREFRDLIWIPEVIETKLDSLAKHIGPISEADRDRWILAPFGRPLPYGSLVEKVDEMKRFAFEGWVPEIATMGPVVPEGGRARHLEELAAAEDEARGTPGQPILLYEGPSEFPADQLVFSFSLAPTSSEMVPPTGFRWRLSDVSRTPPENGNVQTWNSLEWPALWVSREKSIGDLRFEIPPGLTLTERLYRVRTQVKSDSGQWSRWSEPVQFEGGDQLTETVSALRISEIHYHTDSDENLEFLEIVNAGVRSVWLDQLELSGGVHFELEARQRRVLEPNERVLIVKDSETFAGLFSHLRGQLLGSFSGRLSNGGEELQLLVDGVLVQTVVYDDQWYPPSDGEGFTLAANLSEGLDLDWSVADSWRLSDSRFGTPASESTTLDQDGDRIPDLWELDHDLNPLDASDAGTKVPDLDSTWFEVWTDEGFEGGFSDDVRIVVRSEEDGLVLKINSGDLSEFDPLNWVRRVRFERKFSLRSAWFPVSDWLEDVGEGVSLTLNSEMAEVPSFFRASITIGPR